MAREIVGRLQPGLIDRSIHTTILSGTIIMTSSNGNIFRVLAICAGNSPVTGEFPTQRPVTRSFDVFLDLRLIKLLNKQWWGWCFRHHRANYDVTVMLYTMDALKAFKSVGNHNVIALHPGFVLAINIKCIFSHTQKIYKDIIHTFHFTVQIDGEQL